MTVLHPFRPSTVTVLPALDGDGTASRVNCVSLPVGGRGKKEINRHCSAYLGITGTRLSWLRKVESDALRLLE